MLSDDDDGGAQAQEAHAWGQLRNDAAALNAEMDKAMAEIASMRRVVARRSGRRSPRSDTAPLTSLPDIAPSAGRRSSLSAVRTGEATKESDRERLLRQLPRAGCGALDDMAGVLLLEVLPSKRCVHFGTVVAGAVQPSATAMMEKSKAGTAGLDIAEKARKYSSLLARFAPEVSAREGPCLLARLTKKQGGKKSVHIHDVVALQRRDGRKIPKWLRGSVAELPRGQACVEEEEAEAVCSICLESRFHISCVKLHCGHLFHQKCIKQWLQAERDTEQKVFCPMCKQTITDIASRSKA